MHRRLLGLLVVTGLGATPAAVASAQTSTTSTTSTTAPAPLAAEWSRVTDTTGRNIDEAGVARTADGTLHVLWRQRGAAGSGEQIAHTPVSTSGQVGASVTASGPWASAGNPAVIVTADGGLRVFFGGLTGTTAPADGVQSASAKADGQTWTPQGGRVSSTTSAVPEGVGAALRPDGTPVFTYAHSFVLGLHAGLDPATPDTDLRTTNQCCDYLPNLAFAKDGTGVLAWYSNVDGEVGTWVQPIAPSVGTKTLVPQSATDGKALAPSQRTPIVNRAGTNELFVAYCAGYPTCTQAMLWEVGSTAPVVAGTGRDVEDVNVAADPDGRLWVMWEDAFDRSLHVVRTNDDATELGAVVSVAPPSGTDTVWKLQGSATSDALDLFAATTTPGSLATWHSRVRPGLDVTGARKGSTVAFVVTDAGDPVAGAKIRFGKKTVTTDKKGRATAPKGVGVAEVTKAGYSPAALTVG